MASWTDGAAYAPIERPDGFATPEVSPLELATRPAATTPGPMRPPREFRQDSPAVPLAEVRTTAPSTRNASEPFLVSGALMTTASSASHLDARDPRMPFSVRRDGDTIQDADTLPPPTGEPLMLPLSGPPGAPGSGLNAMMSSPSGDRSGPGSLSATEMTTQRTLVFLTVACCLLGFTFGAAAPVLLIIGGGLSLRATVLSGRIGMWAIGAGLVLIMTGFIVAPGLEELYGRLISLAFGGWFGLAAVIRSTGRS